MHTTSDARWFYCVLTLDIDRRLSSTSISNGSIVFEQLPQLGSLEMLKSTRADTISGDIVLRGKNPFCRSGE